MAQARGHQRLAQALLQVPSKHAKKRVFLAAPTMLQPCRTQFLVLHFAAALSWPHRFRRWRFGFGSSFGASTSCGGRLISLSWWEVAHLLNPAVYQFTKKPYPTHLSHQDSHSGSKPEYTYNCRLTKKKGKSLLIWWWLTFLSFWGVQYYVCTVYIYNLYIHIHMSNVGLE